MVIRFSKIKYLREYQSSWDVTKVSNVSWNVCCLYTHIQTNVFIQLKCEIYFYCISKSWKAYFRAQGIFVRDGLFFWGEKKKGSVNWHWENILFNRINSSVHYIHHKTDLLCFLDLKINNMNAMIKQTH